MSTSEAPTAATEVGPASPAGVTSTPAMATSTAVTGSEAHGGQ
jgi:hypothetical protein